MISQDIWRYEIKPHYMYSIHILKCKRVLRNINKVFLLIEELSAEKKPFRFMYLERELISYHTKKKILEYDFSVDFIDIYMSQLLKVLFKELRYNGPRCNLKRTLRSPEYSRFNHIIKQLSKKILEYDPKNSDYIKKNLNCKIYQPSLSEFLIL